MLELKNIKKDYPAGGETVEALKGINLQFRKSQFGDGYNSHPKR